ncbi:MAG: ABC transporter ATP-binding protein [Candidatus Omnitrophica bacterium]|nr:ABC transporter ATP-binding protein [Candidatus Omnitrophota bacterium]
MTETQIETVKPAGVATSNSVVRLEDVRKTYQMGSQEVHALRGVTTAFERGSFWAIMGPSGSGKSTMLNLLGCLDRPSAGKYYLEDQDVSALDDNSLSDFRLSHLGFVFQSFNLIPQLSVRENIELPLFYLGWEAEESRERACQLADRVGLGDRLDHRPMELSGGQQQRVAVARALSNDPAIVLADEPTGNLDSATGVQIMNLLDEVNSLGKTIILVTHEPDIAEYAHHQLHMKDGVIDFIG